MKQKISLEEAIWRRKATRRYEGELSEKEIENLVDYAAKIEPLFPGVKVKFEVVKADEVKSISKWRAPYYFALYAEDSDKGLMNIGFILEQLVLYMTSLGLGTCWAASTSPIEKHENDGTKWAAVVAFGKPQNDPWRNNDEFTRKSLAEISDVEDEKLDAARVAPSSMNNQPWYFVHDGDNIEVFVKKQGLLKKWMIPQNRIDMGIALANLKVANKKFEFKAVKTPKTKAGYAHIGTIRLG